jgi:3-methyladenine DNA glycosylase AlkC
MAAALKHQFNQAWLQNWQNKLLITFPKLNKQNADHSIHFERIKNLSLMQIIQKTSFLALKQLKEAGYDFEKICFGLNALAPCFRGLHGLVLTQMVEDLGVDYPQTSFSVLEVLTQYATAEFAMRPFIQQHPEQTFAQLTIWSQSVNPHLRRLASEACRPRLPWAKALNELKSDPTPILPILQNMMQDNSEYVRKSVANNLNDIAKDHPQVLLDFAQAWLGKGAQADWIIKHACRNFIKQRDPRFLPLFNLPSVSHITVMDWHNTPEVAVGDALDYGFSLQSPADSKLGLLRIEIQVDYFRPARPALMKVFKLSESNYSVTQKSFSKSISFKPLTTRRYYAGTHQIRLILNGEVVHRASFEVREVC